MTFFRKNLESRAVASIKTRILLPSVGFSGWPYRTERLASWKWARSVSRPVDWATAAIGEPAPTDCIPSSVLE